MRARHSHTLYLCWMRTVVPYFWKTCSSETTVGRSTLIRNPPHIIVGMERRRKKVVEIVRGLQQAAIQVSGQGKESISCTTQKPMMTMKFEIITIKSSFSTPSNSTSSQVAFAVSRAPSPGKS